MGYRDPKTEGPAAHAASTLMSLVAHWHQLADVQVQSIFSELAAQADGASDHGVPDDEQWTAWIDRVHRKIGQTRSLSVRRQDSLHARLDRARLGQPNARLWFALRHLDNDTKSRVIALNGYLAQIARIAGRPAADVTAEFWARHASAGTARSNGDGRQARTRFRGDVPSDYATITVLAAMRREAIQGAHIVTIEHTTLTDGPISSYGYDPATQRLEVAMAGTLYAYRVPPAVIAPMRGMDSHHASQHLLRKVLPSPAYAWEPGEASARVCPACSDVVGHVHQCAGPAQAPYAQPALVTLDPAAERLAPDGTVLVLLRSAGMRNDLMVTGEVTLPVVVITAPDHAASVLGARYTITGDLIVRPDGPDTSALTCSCPSPTCSHRELAGRQVHHLVLWGSLPAVADLA